MKNKHLYVPVLKYKAAEVKALSYLTSEQKNNLTPLFFLVHLYDNVFDESGEKIKIERSREKILSKAIVDLRDIGTEVMLDISVFWNVNEKNEAWETVMNTGGTLFGNNFIPVLTVEDLKKNNFSNTVKSFLKKQGIGLRILRDEVKDGLWKELDRGLGEIGLVRKDVHLVLDCGLTDINESKEISSILNDNEVMSNWAKITLASGSFRENMGGLTVDTHKHPRNDWKFWNNVLDNLTNLQSTIGYGDYTIQYPIYEIPPENPNPTRSIKYAKEEYWLLLKGQTDTAENSAQAEQYFGQLQILEFSGELCDETCCWGDQYIKGLLARQSTKNCGGFKEWVQVGVNHHMSLTIRQLASL